MMVASRDLSSLDLLSAGVIMNLSHYYLMDPHVNHGDGEKRIEAGGETFPAHDQAAVLPLELRKCALGLKAWGVLFEGTPPRLFRLPDPFRNLRPDPTTPEAMTESLGVVPGIRREDLKPLARSAPFACMDAAGIQQGEDLRPLVAVHRRRARGQWHACRVSKAVDEDAFAFPAIGYALTAALARGKMKRQWRRSAIESSHVPRPAPAGGPSSWRGSHRPASAGAADGRHSWRPIAAHAGGRTSGSP
jgi:hypothetical protein